MTLIQLENKTSSINEKTNFNILNQIRAKNTCQQPSIQMLQQYKITSNIKQDLYYQHIFVVREQMQPKQARSYLLSCGSPS